MLPVTPGHGEDGLARGTDPGQQKKPSNVSSVSSLCNPALGEGGFQSGLLRQPSSLQAAGRDGLFAGWSVLLIRQICHLGWGESPVPAAGLGGSAGLGCAKGGISAVEGS